MFKVCTRCITFNHSAYIKDTFQGFIMQQTSFPVVYAVIDDASTDGESEIIKDYMSENFDLNDKDVVQIEETDDYSLVFAQHRDNKNCYFAYYLLKYNHWSLGAFMKKYDYIYKWEKNAKYIATCEGDDFWTDKMKLQKQVTFMDSHPAYSACFHSYDILTKNGISRYTNHSNVERDYSTDIFIHNEGLFCHMSSLVYKRECVSDLPRFRQMALDGCRYGDWPLTIQLSLSGNLHYLPDVMSCYRFLTDNSWTLRVTKDKQVLYKHWINEISWLKELDNYTNGEFRGVIYYRIALNQLDLYKGSVIPRKEVINSIKQVSTFSDKKVLIKRLLLFEYPAFFKPYSSLKKIIKRK